MTSDQLKQIVEALFNKLIVAADKHPLIDHAFAIVQSFVDTNWALIYPTLPSGAAGSQLINSVLDQIGSLAGNNFVAQLAVQLVKSVVDKYLGQVLGGN